MTNWVKAKFESQSTSFNVIANKIVTNISQPEIKKALIKQMMEDFKKNYDNKTLQTLNMNEWKSLQGTESWNGDTMIKIQKHLKTSNDINMLHETITEMLSGRSVAAPIVMMQNKIGMLISGEHTLMACRLLNIQPRVVMF
jgi:hypothetical protein